MSSGNSGGGLIRLDGEQVSAGATRSGSELVRDAAPAGALAVGTGVSPIDAAVTLVGAGLAASAAASSAMLAPKGPAQQAATTSGVASMEQTNATSAGAIAAVGERAIPAVMSC